MGCQQQRHHFIGEKDTRAEVSAFCSYPVWLDRIPLTATSPSFVSHGNPCILRHSWAEVYTSPKLVLKNTTLLQVKA